MRKISHSSSSLRSRRIGGYRAALERIDAALEDAYPELEKAKIERAMVLLFGEDPIGFYSPNDPKNIIPLGPTTSPSPAP